MKARRQDVGEHGQVADLGHRPRLVGELQQVEVGVGRHDVFRLPPDPAAHVDIAIGAAGPTFVDGQADAGVAMLAGAASAAGHVERNRNQVADGQHLDVGPLLDHLSSNLMAKHHAGRRRRPAAHHMLVGTADIGRDDLENNAVINFPAVWILKPGVRNILHLNLAGSEIHYTTIVAHFGILQTS